MTMVREPREITFTFLGACALAKGENFETTGSLFMKHLLPLQIGGYKIMFMQTMDSLGSLPTAQYVLRVVLFKN